MSTLLQLRTDLADVVAQIGDLTVYTHVPGRMSLPAAFIMAGSPYIEQAETFGARLVRFGVVLAVQGGSNLSETTDLDTRIEQAQAALEADGWLIEQVSQPYAMQFNNADGLVSEITVTTHVTFPQKEAHP